MHFQSCRVSSRPIDRACEKMTDEPKGLIEIAGQKPQLFWEYSVTMPATFGLHATRHMHEFGTKREHFAMVSANNHHYGALNPWSHFRFEVSVERALKAPLVAWPLALFDCCPITDDAAEMIVCGSEILRKYTDAPMYVAESGFATNPVSVNMRSQFMTMEPTIEASKQACAMAKMSPKDIDFAEVHHCFTPVEIVAYEELRVL